MAKIEVTGWVSDWKFQNSEEPNPEWGMKLSEAHSKKTGDSWEVVGHTRFTVKAAYGVSIDFRQYKSGDRVKVTGTQVTEEREQYKNLVIKAETIEVLPSRPSAKVSAMIAATLPSVEDAPF